VPRHEVRLGADRVPGRGRTGVLCVAGQRGFLLDGGAALLARQLTTRPTQDLDFFTSPRAGVVQQARTEFAAVAATRGWVIETIRDSDTFCRLLVHGPEDLLVDIALDSAPGRPATASILGPTFAPEELVGRKVVALFDRAAPRDFVDVFMSGWTALRHALTRSSRRPVIRTGPRDRRIGAGRHPSTRANRASFWCTTASTRTHLTIRTPNG
jgi:hypothetical protein